MDTLHGIFTFITWLTGYCLRSLNDLFVAWTTPETTSLQLGTLIDLSRSKSELVAENARHASTIDHPASSGEPAYLSQDGPRTPGPTGKHSADLETGPLHRSARDASAVASSGLQTLLEVQVEGSFSQAKNIPGDRRLDPGDGKGQPASSEQNGFVVSALSLGIHVSKRTIQKDMRQVRATRPRGQTWKTFLYNHAKDIWACDCLQVTDLFFRSLFAFFIIDLRSRRVIHVGVTRSPTDAWTAQQLREATPFGQGPKFLIRDRDSKFGPNFERVAVNSGIKILKTPYRTPRANAICERFLGSVRRECLDHLLILQEKQHEPRPQCIHRLLQPVQAASRDPAADP